MFLSISVLYPCYKGYCFLSFNFTRPTLRSAFFTNLSKNLFAFLFCLLEYGILSAHDLFFSTR